MPVFSIAVMIMNMLFMVVLCIPPASAASADSAMSIDPGSFADDIVASLMKDEALVGAGIALVFEDQPAWSKGYGLASVDSGLPLTAHTPGALHELAQLFTAVGIMQLVEAGLLDLDASYQRYMPQFRPFSGGEGNDSFTIRQLLSHHSGLAAWYGPGSGSEDFQTDTSALAYRKILDNSADLALVAAPGSVYEYSYLGYTLLGLLIEKISGLEFAQYMQTRVIEPLHLQNTFFVPDPDLIQGISAAHVKDNEVPHKKFRDIPAVGLVSSMSDMALFMQALLTPDTGLLGQSSLDEMFRPQNRDIALDANFGIGLGVFTTPVTGGAFRDLPSASHASTDGVARAYMLAFPQYRLGVILTTNSRLSSVSLRDTVDRIMERMLVSATGASPKPFEPHDAQPYVRAKVQDIAGTYGGPGGTYFVVPEKNSLKLEVPYIPFISVNLLPRAEDYFGVELRFLGFLKVPGFAQLQLLANSVEGRLQHIDGHDMIYWYWRGVAVVSLTKVFPPEASLQKAWEAYLGDYRSEENAMTYRFARDEDSGAFTFGPYEKGFRLFREPPELFCAQETKQIKTCGLGLVGNGTRNLLRVMPDGTLRSAYGVSYSAIR